ncbi:MAG: type II toxin-antitoxin system HicA family toxin [Mogibacterium sp.]|nr:type II toxin-antitoxin system HicA family toxin [Mogibacterium sp.]
MKVSELLKQVRATGKCRLLVHGSEHDIWYSEITHKKFQIPRHQAKEIPPGTLHRIKKDAGLE